MTDIITGPGNYCRADGVKVWLRRYRDMWEDESGELLWYPSGKKYAPKRNPPNMNIISTWLDRPDEFRKPKPAYRKDGSPRWPVGTRAALVEWENGWKVGIKQTMTVTDNGPKGDDGDTWAVFHKGERPLIRKIKDTAQRPRNLVILLTVIIKGIP